MPIPELQLQTWSHQGSVTQSASTYESIRKVLNDTSSPYYTKDFSIFLQGSYGNDTNVYKESDVDIVICLNQTYYSDTNKLTEDAKNNYDNQFSLAPYQYNEFKADVISWLTKAFGSDVNLGKKAILIKANGIRRNVDVLVCAKHRRYWESSNGNDHKYDEGICFWTSDGTQIINYPEQHANNCTIKHQETSKRFKPMVRVYKNMRNRMIEDGYIVVGIAPSYFIEGMLWNVPENYFSNSYEDTFVNTFNWLLSTDKTQLSCASDLYWLVRDNTHNCWSTANFDKYMSAVNRFWRDWI